MLGRGNRDFRNHSRNKMFRFQDRDGRCPALFKAMEHNLAIQRLARIQHYLGSMTKVGRGRRSLICAVAQQVI